MVKKSWFCDICGEEFSRLPDTKAISIEERSDHFHTPGIGFTISLDICRKCQSVIQETIDRLSGASVER